MTDLITLPRATVQQALEALDALDAPPSGVVNHYELERRKQALRDALPCTYKCEAWPECACAALEQPEQEPVARPTVDEFAQHIRWINGGHKMGAGVLAESLLEWLQSKDALPRREWQGLTDTDIARVFRAVYGGARFGPSEKEFAIAVEAKLKEKNHG